MADKPPSFLLSIRFMLALLGFLAYATQYTQKINMSVAIVCMINNTALSLQNNGTELAHEKLSEETLYENSSVLIGKSGDPEMSLVEDKCGAVDKNKKPMKDGPFPWTKDMQGLILATYFIGYFITEIPGGYMSLKFGPKRVLAISLLTSSILTMALPFFARFHYTALLFVRFVIGLAH
ncbi:sialin-like, partial [Brachionus plicatilis]